jgi:hypothetical protein
VDVAAKARPCGVMRAQVWRKSNPSAKDAKNAKGSGKIDQFSFAAFAFFADNKILTLKFAFWREA